MRLAIGKRRVFVMSVSLLFAVIVALVAFAWVSEPSTTDAATDDAAKSLGGLLPRQSTAQTVR